MKITKIESQKNKNRVNVYIDENFAFGIDIEILYKYSLEVDMEIDESFIKDVLQGEEQNRANNYALNLLSYRWRSECEIRNSMNTKGYSQDTIDNTIKFLKEQELIDDRRFAESFIKDKINFRDWGSYRLKQELFSKGVSKNIVDEVIEKYCDDEFERAMNLASKKIKSYKNDDKNAIYRKLGGYLQRKGYSYDVISSVLKELLK
ncbi:RecX family transcriptional regulator [Sporanaerobacter acetigenes]|uniref:Regulatory protein RecX n=1 Tax=Sporanaerobacter acetigenes DSM 13106 TaxID=1123281 RepID=A0A1M5Z221_9FIRM|nr:RecX family transcriptional regulator [Sporanaerobacter acetigenes]SHI18259.1 regulatory protein [Sporanaerobacter acetigenes DSM 13106]